MLIAFKREAGMGKRAGYNTEQRRQVIACLDKEADRYQTIDDILVTLRSAGSTIGRTTVYRTVEKLVADGEVAKVTGVRGSSASYKRLPEQGENAQGQLLCVRCGRAFPLDCSMLQSFSDHIREHHGFVVDQRRTVICGVCEDCQRAEGEVPEGNVSHDQHDCTHQPTEPRP